MTKCMSFHLNRPRVAYSVILAQKIMIIYNNNVRFRVRRTIPVIINGMISVVFRKLLKINIGFVNLKFANVSKFRSQPVSYKI